MFAFYCVLYISVLKFRICYCLCLYFPFPSTFFRTHRCIMLNNLITVCHFITVSSTIVCFCLSAPDVISLLIGFYVLVYFLSFCFSYITLRYIKFKVKKCLSTSDTLQTLNDLETMKTTPRINEIFIWF